VIWNFFYFKSIGIHSILEALQLYKSTTDVESDVAVAVVVIVYMYIVVCGPHHVHSVDVANSYRWSSMVDVCLCVCLLVTTVSPAKMDELIRIVFGMWIHGAQGTMVVWISSLEWALLRGHTGICQAVSILIVTHKGHHALIRPVRLHYCGQCMMLYHAVRVHAV